MRPHEQIDSATSASEARLHSTLEHIASVQFWNFRRLAYSSKKNRTQTRKGLYERNETRVATIQAARSIKRSRIVLGISKRACSEGGLFEQA